MKRPKFAIGFSCEHVERAGDRPFVEVGRFGRGPDVTLYRSCNRGECVSRWLVPLLSELPPVDVQAVAASVDAVRVAVAPSAASGWIARLVVWCLRFLSRGKGVK